MNWNRVRQNMRDDGATEEEIEQRIDELLDQDRSEPEGPTGAFKYKLPECVAVHKFMGVYTADQMQSAYQSGRDAMRYEAAQACIAIALAPSNCTLGVAIECAQKVRALK
jgi:hypothetical protein